MYSKFCWFSRSGIMHDVEISADHVYWLWGKDHRWLSYGRVGHQESEQGGALPSHLPISQRPHLQRPLHSSEHCAVGGAIPGKGAAAIQTTHRYPSKVWLSNAKEMWKEWEVSIIYNTQNHGDPYQIGSQMIFYIKQQNMFVSREGRGDKGILLFIWMFVECILQWLQVRQEQNPKEIQITGTIPGI